MSKETGNAQLTQTLLYSSDAFHQNWRNLGRFEPLSRTRRERHFYIFELLKAITAISVLISIFSFAFALRNRHDDQVAHRKEEALKLLRQWDERFSGDRQKVLTLWRTVQTPPIPLEEMPPETARRLWAAADPDSGWTGNQNEQELATLLVSLLNFLESISVAVQSEAADTQMMRGSVETPLIDWRRRLKPFTDAADTALSIKNKRPTYGWRPLYDLADGWAWEAETAKGERATRPQHIYGTRP